MNWVSNNEAWHTSDSVSCSSSIRDLYKLQRLLLRKCHLKIDHWVVRFLVISSQIGEVSFYLLGGNGFHVMAENQRFTAVSLRCRQKIKCENCTSSFGRLQQKACRTCIMRILNHSTNQIRYLWHYCCRCRLSFLWIPIACLYAAFMSKLSDRLNLTGYCFIIFLRQWVWWVMIKQTLGHFLSKDHLEIE